jgi:hypothetical protein
MDRYFNLHCGALQLLQGSGLSLASLINALLAWSMNFGGRPSLGRFVVVPYSLNFLNNGFNGALWDV